MDWIGLGLVSWLFVILLFALIPRRNDNTHTHTHLSFLSLSHASFLRPYSLSFFLCSFCPSRSHAPLFFLSTYPHASVMIIGHSVCNVAGSIQFGKRLRVKKKEGNPAFQTKLQNWAHTHSPIPYNNIPKPPLQHHHTSKKTKYPES